MHPSLLQDQGAASARYRGDAARTTTVTTVDRFFQAATALERDWQGTIQGFGNDGWIPEVCPKEDMENLLPQTMPYPLRHVFFPSVLSPGTSPLSLPSCLWPDA